MSTDENAQSPAPGDAAHPDDQLIGERVAGKYQVLRKLGAGGMGAVYEAEQQPLGRKVALKVIKRALTDEPTAVKRFINEARAVAQLNHTNIVTIHDFGAVDGGEPTAGKALYIAMELLEGHDLRHEILKHQRLDWRRSCRIVAEVARALAEAHTRGIVHRDLKPDNVMLLASPGDDVRIKVVDFGVAKLLPEHGGTQGMTGTGMVVGTPGYISPEQINGIGDDPRSDLYALGVMWFEMLAGFSPYDAETPVKLVLKHLTEPVPSLAAALPAGDLPDGVELLVRSLMAKAPEERPANAVLLINEIERMLSTDSGLAPHQATEAAVPAAAIAEVASTPSNALPPSTSGGSVASFPRPAPSDTSTAAAPAAPAAPLAPAASTPETGQALPMQVSAEQQEAASVAAKPRGCLSTFMVGCFALIGLAVVGSCSVVIAGVAFGPKQKDATVALETTPVVEAPPGPAPEEAPQAINDDKRKAKRKARSDKRSKPRREPPAGTRRATAAAPDPPAVPARRSFNSQLTIAHPAEHKHRLAYDAYTSASKRKRRSVFMAVDKLVKREGPLPSIQILSAYYEHNAALVAPESPAADKLEEATELVWEQFGRVVGEDLPGVIEALGEGGFDWMGGSAP